MEAPALRSDSACSTVASMSWVLVAHMLCTAIGESPPIEMVLTRTFRVGFLWICMSGVILIVSLSLGKKSP